MSKNNVNKKPGFFKKVYFTFKFLSINPIVSYCNYCHSYAISKYDEKQEDEDTYIGTYYCRNCGATMLLVEKWKKYEEPKTE